MTPRSFHRPFVGEERRGEGVEARRGVEGSMEQMPSCQGTKEPSITLSSLLCAPSSFHQPRIKVALCI